MIASVTKKVRCAIYTQVSTEAGLDQDFNSLDAQYNMMPHRPIYVARPMLAGLWCAPDTTTVAFRADQPIGRPYSIF